MMIKFFRSLWDGVNSSRLLIFTFYFSLMTFFLYLPTIVYLFRPSNELNICTFADLIDLDAKYFERFEQKTGIRVNVKYVELDSEILVQLVAGKGAGFDLVTPSDVIVSQLVKAGLLQKLNYQLLEKKVRSHDTLSKKDFDPGLNYCLPFAWTYYSIGYNKSYFEGSGVVPDSLQAIFDPDVFFGDHTELLKNYKVALLEDNPQELLLIGGLYLFGDVSGLTERSQVARIIDLYGQHKHRWLYAYISSNMLYYLSSVVPVVLSFTSTLKRAIEEDSSVFGSACPKEGSVLVPQNFCIPSGAKNVEAAHKLIDFFMSDEVLEEIFETSGYIPADDKMLKQLRNNHEFGALVPNESLLEKMIPVTRNFSFREIERAWLAVKCADKK